MRNSKRRLPWYAAIAAVAAAALVTLSLNALPALGESSATADGAMQVLPGKLIGADYEPDKFYVRQGDGKWELTYTPGWQGKGFSDKVRGSLLNLRSANAVFDDESGKIKDYDPDFDAGKNTDAFVSHLDDYREHGLMATDVNLQGGNPGYDGADNPGFNSDGSLKQEWMDRAGKVIEESAKRNMVVVLGYFYFGQIDALDGDDAIRNAVTNVTDWLIKHEYRNVVIEIANEHNDPDYPDIISSDDGMAELIKLAQSRFDNADFKLAVGASRWGDGSGPQGAAADASDVAMMHCNGLDADKCADAAADNQKDYDYPVLLNETDNTAGEYNDDTFAEDNASIDKMIPTGASWGYMLNQWNQYAACKFHDDCGAEGFDWSLGSQPGVNGDGADLTRNFAHGVLDHLQGAVFTSQ